MFLAIGMVVAAGFVSLERATPWVDDEPASVEMSADDGTITLTFQKGDGGAFSETDDTYIRNTAPDTNFGANPKLLVDASGCKISASTACKTLIKFPLVVGPSDGQIPQHSTIVDARLDLNVKNAGSYQDGEQLTEAWTESGATWNSFAYPGMPGIQGPTVLFYPDHLGTISINITFIVQRWADGQTNEGVFLHSDDPDGVDYDSSEAASGRPTLTVRFVPPPAGSPTVVDLGTLPGGDRSVASDLNDAGQIVGWSTNASGATHAVLWADGTITDLGMLPGDISSSAEDINDAGAIVGTSRPTEPGLGHAFLWQDGVMTDLGTLGGSLSFAHGINNVGQVVGESLTASGERHAFLWSNGTMTDLGYPSGYEPSSWAYAINDAGQVVGAITNDGMKGRHGALWEAGVWTDIVGIGVTKWATDINAEGRVVGASEACCGEAHAWMWDNGTLTDLGTLFPRTGWAKAFGINDAGQIVGDSLSAFRWEDGAMMNLGDLGYGGGVAYGINATGDAVGSSAASGDGTIHAVLWSFDGPPSVPGPSTRTFQKGDGGAFSETDDTYILSGTPDTNYGARLAMFVDASGCHFGVNAACKALIGFPDFLGPGPGQVHAGSVIVSATLEFTITNPGGTQLLYQVTEGWTELGATWNGFATPGSPGTKGTGLSFNAPLGVITVNITTIVQNWVNGDANYGLLIWSNSADGVDYCSSESTDPPKLTVTFHSP